MTVFWMTSCRTSMKKNSIEQKSADKYVNALMQAEKGILHLMKKNGINPKGKRLIFTSHGQIRHDSGYRECEPVEKQIEFKEFGEVIGIGTNFISAFIVDENGVYFANASRLFIEKNAEVLTSNSRNLLLIDLMNRESI